MLGRVARNDRGEMKAASVRRGVMAAKMHANKELYQEEVSRRKLGKRRVVRLHWCQGDVTRQGGARMQPREDSTQNVSKRLAKERR